jgi:hypothetical protein
VAGRVRTDRRDGFLLDRGFQVLLPAYPELRRQADLSALKPRAFLRGVLAVTTAGRSWLAAPWHGHQALAGAAGFLLGHPRDSAAMAAMSLRDTLAPGPVVRAADPAATTMEDLRRRFSAPVRTGTQITEVAGSGVRTKAGEHLRATAVVIATDGASAAALVPTVAAPAKAAPCGAYPGATSLSTTALRSNSSSPSTTTGHDDRRR